MKLKEVLAELEKLSNLSTFAHNTKLGVGENQFGVKLGDIRKIANKIKKNQELAFALWETGNLDAQLVACLIINPKVLTLKELEEIVNSINSAQVADWFNSYVLKEYPDNEKVRETWCNSKNKWAARSGWSLTTGRISRNPEGLDIVKILDRIEKEMAKTKPEVQWTMNFALAQIGIHFPKYRKRAIEIGEKLGIYRDFPVSKGCTSPFAPIWINEIVSREKK